MLPERALDRDVYSVFAWKDNLDSFYHWWQKAYFRFLFLPILRFSFRYFKIPSIKQVTVKVTEDSHGTKHTETTFAWFENQGIFEDESQAVTACIGPRYGYKRLPLNRSLPPDTLQYSGDVFPLAKKPNRAAKPVMELVATPRRKLERSAAELKNELTKLNKALGA